MPDSLLVFDTSLVAWKPHANHWAFKTDLDVSMPQALLTIPQNVHHDQGRLLCLHTRRIPHGNSYFGRDQPVTTEDKTLCIRHCPPPKRVKNRCSNSIPPRMGFKQLDKKNKTWSTSIFLIKFHNFIPSEIIYKDMLEREQNTVIQYKREMWQKFRLKRSQSWTLYLGLVFLAVDHKRVTGWVSFHAHLYSKQGHPKGVSVPTTQYPNQKEKAQHQQGNSRRGCLQRI